MVFVSDTVYALLYTPARPRRVILQSAAAAADDVENKDGGGSRDRDDVTAGTDRRSVGAVPRSVCPVSFILQSRFYPQATQALVLL